MLRKCWSQHSKTNCITFDPVAMGQKTLIWTLNFVLFDIMWDFIYCTEIFWKTQLHIKQFSFKRINHNKTKSYHIHRLCGIRGSGVCGTWCFLGKRKRINGCPGSLSICLNIGILFIQSVKRKSKWKQKMFMGREPIWK